MAEQIGTPYAPPANLATILAVGRDRGFPEQMSREWLAKIGIADTLASRNLYAMQFLGIVDKDGFKTDLAEKIRVAPSDKYHAVLEAVIREAYSRIFAVVDPATKSRTSIDDAFRFEKPEGQRPRMVACFVGLCKLAKMALKEPPIGGRPTGADNAKTKAVNKVIRSGAILTPPILEPPSPTPPLEQPPTPAIHLELLLAKFPNFDPSWPDTLKDKWFDGFSRLQDQLSK